MGEVHQLIVQHGADGARALVETRAARQTVDAAAAILADEETRLGITHAGFAMTSLLHRCIADPLWTRQGGRTKLLVESGRNGDGSWIGVPYGSVARLILLYLQTEAIRTNSPEVELGRSMRSWMTRMSLASGGRNYQLVAEQARRISACRLTFLTDLTGGSELRHNGAFVQDAISLAGSQSETQPSLWQDRLRLDSGFWKSLKDHPVPVHEEAIRAIGPRSMAIDGYIWLAYRLHSLTKTTPVTWPAVHAQFGAGFKAIRQMKPVFVDALNLALAVYPEAQVDIETTGLSLHPSPPAVPKLEARRLGIL